MQDRGARSDTRLRALPGARSTTIRLLERLIRTIAIVTSLLVAASFVMFARDQIAGASEHQVAEIAAGVQHTPGVTRQATHHAQPRRFIDGAARELLSPFAGVSSSSDGAWARRIAPTLLALLTYGVGLGFLARYARGLP